MIGSRTLRRAVAPLRPLLWRGETMKPGYLVVGTKRGGSTSIAEWITRHPEVAPCRTAKGTHYFDVNFDRGASWYYSAFPKQSGEWKITGEASPYYMFHPLSPERIAAELPDVKLLLCLRDPVARAWSHHAYETARGHETETFERALDLEPERLAGEAQAIIDDPSYNSPAWRYQAYLRRGHYDEQLAHLYTLFDPAQVYVMQSERAFADPNGELAKVFDFLGVSAHHLEDLAPKNANKPYGDMPTPMVHRLREYYRPHNERLYALPGVDFAWPDGV